MVHLLPQIKDCLRGKLYKVKYSLFIFQSWGVLKTHPFTGWTLTSFTTHGNDYFSGAQFTIFVRKPTKHDDNLGRMLTLRIKQKSLVLAVHDKSITRSVDTKKTGNHKGVDIHGIFTDFHEMGPLNDVCWSKTITGWWFPRFNPSEKYELVSWDDDISQYMEK